MALTTAEQESLRFHLGYGNLSNLALPYTPDTFYSIFASVISPNLSTGTETSSTTTVVSGTNATVTPAAMTGITVYGQLVVDVGDAAEIVLVAAVTPTSFTATFSNGHSVGYPVATMSGTARLRLLLWQADQAWQRATSWTIGITGGLKSVDKGDVEWWQGFRVLKDKISTYQAIVGSISDLVRVRPAWQSFAGGGGAGARGRLQAF